MGETATWLKSWERCHNRLLDISQHKPQQLRRAVLHCLLAGKCVPLRHTPWEAVKDWTTLSFGWQLTRVPQVLCSRCNDNFTPWASSPTWLAEFQWVDKYQYWPLENAVACEHVMHSIPMNSFSCKQSNPACMNFYYTTIMWDEWDEFCNMVSLKLNTYSLLLLMSQCCQVNWCCNLCFWELFLFGFLWKPCTVGQCSLRVWKD